MRRALAIVVFIGVVAVGILGTLRLESSPPVLDAPVSILVGAREVGVPIEIGDDDSGLRHLSIVLVHADGEEVVLDESYPGDLLRGGSTEGPLSVDVVIDPKGLPDGSHEARLRIAVRDWSWRRRLSGNVAYAEIPVSIDLRPPRIRVATGLSYVRRGGAGVVVYTVDEESARDGVRVGETFFPGYAFGEGRVAFYAVPTDAPPDPEIRVVAEDRAGNAAAATWPVVMRERELPTANITLPERFLASKVPELAGAQNIDATDRVAAFNTINTELRRKNEQHIRRALSDSASDRLWSGAFRQLANSKVTSRFAERRSYFVAGQKISEATHFGYDLASTRAAPITAANSGRVVYAGDLGIYGNCILVDHGLGVSSLYAHLSRMDAAVGDDVQAGQTLGLSGATGLAGGDHLHFSILVGGTYVDPLEWWDAKWVQTNIEARLTP